jgi:hypothetical protein
MFAAVLECGRRSAMKRVRIELDQFKTAQSTVRDNVKDKRACQERCCRKMREMPWGHAGEGRFSFIQVIPAKAGIQVFIQVIPAKAGIQVFCIFAFVLLLKASVLLAVFSSERVPQKDASPGCMVLDADFRRHDCLGVREVSRSEVILV